MSETWQSYISAVEDELRRLLAAREQVLEPLYGMMRYSLGWTDTNLRPTQAPGGKRVRPLLCLFSCAAVGGDWRQAVPLAASLELIHNFSLLHDDIEDGSTTRRHRPTAWTVWGIAQATNTGDAMFSLAHLAAHGLRERSVDTEVILAVLHNLQQACLALCEGQYLDIAFESQEQVPLAAYLRMIEGKTAALLRCAAETGALVGAGLEGPHAALRTFGHELGLAFQIVDDLLGIWGNPDVTGKPAADDLRRRKKTLPLLHGLQVLTAQGNSSLQTLLAQASLSEADVATAIALLEATGARQYATDLASAHTERALAALEGATPPSPARDALRSLALALVARDR